MEESSGTFTNISPGANNKSVETRCVLRGDVAAVSDDALVVLPRVTFHWPLWWEMLQGKVFDAPEEVVDDEEDRGSHAVSALRAPPFC